MMRSMTVALIACGSLLGQLVSAPVFAEPQETPQQRAAMLKEWMKASQAQLRHYEWIETTTVSVNGEQKSQMQKRCYYGVDGSLTKIDLTPASDPDSGLPIGPLRRKIAEQKREEMTEYMHNAVALVHSYIPPNPASIQQVISAGKLSMQVLDPGHKVQLNLADYFKPQDSLGAQIELPTNRLLGLTVNSYLDTTDDPVALNVMMSVLPDGTIYAERSVLNATAKNLSITVENSGYQRTAQ